MPDIVERLRDAIALEGISVVELRSLLAEAATLIERQRTTLASWEASAAMTRGSLERTERAIEMPSFVILPGDPTTPR